METQVRTPQAVFMHPQRLIVPLFQRPYVWSRESQWEPLWDDVTRVAERLLAEPKRPPAPHFLGAVVLQQHANPSGSLQMRTIIDGQQRLTTLQLLLDAMHAELTVAGTEREAARLEDLIANGKAYCETPADQFKVWPTNRDRPAFNDVMGCTPPVDYDTLGHTGERLVEGHRYFAEQCRAWLTVNGEEDVPTRAAALERTVRELLQMVVIDLAADENAQEIFETLNARGSQLTAADLIKNFVFQRLSEDGADVEAAYEEHWRQFETAFWEAEVSSGRMRAARSSTFLGHWLVAQTGEELSAREVFNRFKRFADHDTGAPMSQLVIQIARAAGVYRTFVESAPATGALDRAQLFSYRTAAMETEIVRPVVLVLLDPDQPAVPDEQLHKALRSLESWLVRRMLVRATSKSYSQVMAELVRELRKGDRQQAGEVIEAFFRDQTGLSRYWPDDNELRRELASARLYRRLSRGRLRMVLEAIEDDLRGFSAPKPPKVSERVPRSALAIEHVMPQQWQKHWPLHRRHDEAARNALVHTLGNLTLLTGRLNASVSNGPWLGDTGKRKALKAHDVLLLNRELRQLGARGWSEELIEQRTSELTDRIIAVWPVPPGHTSDTGAAPVPPKARIDLADLIAANLLAVGQTLQPRTKQHRHIEATVLADGRLDVDGTIYGSPSAAATAITGSSRNGMWFFLADTKERTSLRDLCHRYVELLADDEDDTMFDTDEDDA